MARGLHPLKDRKRCGRFGCAIVWLVGNRVHFPPPVDATERVRCRDLHSVNSELVLYESIQHQPDSRVSPMLPKDSKRTCLTSQELYSETKKGVSHILQQKKPTDAADSFSAPGASGRLHVVILVPPSGLLGDVFQAYCSEMEDCELWDVLLNLIRTHFTASQIKLASR